MAAADYRLMTEATGQRIAAALEALSGFGAYLTTADVVNNLNSIATDKPLSAAQGKELNDQIANNQSYLTSETATGGTIDGIDVYRKKINVDSAGMIQDSQWRIICSSTGIVSSKTINISLTIYSGIYMYTSLPVYIDSSGNIGVFGNVGGNIDYGSSSFVTIEYIK